MHGIECEADMVKQGTSELPVIGWREWVGLPDLGIPSIKVKVDTGARSSSLHTFALQEFERDGVTWVRFQVHPVQRTNQEAVDVEAEVLELRSVRSSSGKAALRPVIVTRVTLLGIPRTTFVRDKKDVLPASERVGGAPVIIKLLEGTQGIGVLLAESIKSAEGIIELLQSQKQNVLIQKAGIP